MRSLAFAKESPLPFCRDKQGRKCGGRMIIAAINASWIPPTNQLHWQAPGRIGEDLQSVELQMKSAEKKRFAQAAIPIFIRAQCRMENLLDIGPYQPRTVTIERSVGSLGHKMKEATKKHISGIIFRQLGASRALGSTLREHNIFSILPGAPTSPKIRFADFIHVLGSPVEQSPLAAVPKSKYAGLLGEMLAEHAHPSHFELPSTAGEQPSGKPATHAAQRRALGNDGGRGKTEADHPNSLEDDNGDDYDYDDDDYDDYDDDDEDY